MQTIWKFPLLVTDAQEIDMPEGARLLAVQVQGDAPCVWARVEPQNPTVRRRLYIAGTGHPLYSDLHEYVATFQLPRHGLVFHVFDGGEF